MGGNISTVLETQHRKMTTIAHICCSDKYSNEFHDSVKPRLLVRHIQKEKSSKLSVRHWSATSNSNCINDDYCNYCVSRNGQYEDDHSTLVHTRSNHPTVNQKSRQRIKPGMAEPPAAAVRRKSEPLPEGWFEVEIATLKQAVESTAKDHRIPPPSFAQLQVQKNFAVRSKVCRFLIKFSLCIFGAFRFKSKMILAKKSSYHAKKSLKTLGGTIRCRQNIPRRFASHRRPFLGAP